jgi:pseudaminic acid cytidylyltransferase
MSICIIPARGGSKYIPRKNIKEFNGKPIITYSTDDNEIAKVAKKYGTQVPFIRPIELSGGYTGTIRVIKHVIKWL